MGKSRRYPDRSAIDTQNKMVLVPVLARSTTDHYLNICYMDRFLLWRVGLSRRHAVLPEAAL